MPIRARRRLDCCELEDRVLLSATPLGGETLVNTTTADVQNLDPETTAAAADADGNLVVVWTSANQDGSGDGVFGQRWDDAGNQLGSEFQINTTTAGDQRHAATARDPVGNFVVVWESDGQDGSGWGIFGQRFDAAGNAVGGEFQINTTTSGDQRGASVAIDAAGNFVVTWSSDGQDGSGWGVYGRRFDAAGTALGSEFLVNTYTTGNQQQASVAANADGQFAIVWTSDGQDGSSGGVYLRRYDSDGTALAAPTRVNQTTSGDQAGASVSINADGDVLVAWQSFGQDLILVGDYGVYARRYDSSGAAVGGEFQVNTYTLLAQAEPTALLRDDGRFYVAWTSFGQDFLVLGTDGVYLQSYAADGSTDGTETLINSTIFGDQAAPTLVGQTPNNLAIVWSGEGAGDTAGIFLQRLVDGANTAPVNTVPGAQTTAYETALVLANATSNAPSLADATAGGATMQMILSVTNGTLTLPGTTGLTFLVGDGTDESAMTFCGNISAINAALNGLSFTPTAAYSGPALLTMTSSDLGRSGIGGTMTDVDTVAITVGAALLDPEARRGAAVPVRVGVPRAAAAVRVPLRRAERTPSFSLPTRRNSFSLPATKTPRRPTTAIPSIPASHLRRLLCRACDSMRKSTRRRVTAHYARRQWRTRPYCSQAWYRSMRVNKTIWLRCCRKTSTRHARARGPVIDAPRALPRVRPRLR